MKKNIGWIIGGVILVGGGIGLWLYLRNKPDKDGDEELTDEETKKLVVTPVVIDNTPTDVSQVNLDVEPPAVTSSSKDKSYGYILTRFKSFPKTKQYSDYFTYTANPTALGLQGQPKDYTAMVKFQKNGGWRLYLMRNGKQVKFLTGGMYYKAGTKLVVYNGINKGLIVEGKNPLNNVIRAVRS